MAGTTNRTWLERVWAFCQSARFRNIVFVLGLLFVEGILAARYGADTWRMAYAEHLTEWQPGRIPTALTALDVGLIDGVFLLLLLVAKFFGDSSKATKLRPFAAIGAIWMFVVMILVALKVISVIFASRMAGGWLLAYITSDIVIDIYHKAAAGRRSQSRTFSERMIAANKMIGFLIVLLFTAPVAWLVTGFAGVWRGYFTAQTEQIKTVQSEQPKTVQLRVSRLNRRSAAKLDNQIVQAMQNDPDISLSKLATKLNRSRTTITTHVEQLKAAGLVFKNGHGWQVQTDPVKEAQ